MDGQEDQVCSSARKSFEDPRDAGQLADWIDPCRSCPPLGLARSSTHYLLLTLERTGYLYRNKRTSRYMFGVKLFTLANTGLDVLE